jgi:hypothetical protein
MTKFFVWTALAFFCKADYQLSFFLLNNNNALIHKVGTAKHTFKETFTLFIWSCFSLLQSLGLLD